MQKRREKKKEWKAKYAPKVRNQHRQNPKKSGGFRHAEKGAGKVHIGTISVTSKGSGYVALPNFEDDIEIPAEKMNTALHRDTVEIKLLPQRGPRPHGQHTIAGARQQGEVIKVMDRAKTRFVGTVTKDTKDGEKFFLKPDDRKMYAPILLVNYETAPLPDHKVLVKMLTWADNRRHPQGEILRVIGKAGGHDVEIQSIVLEQGFSIDFPEAVEKEAERIRHEKKPIPPSDFEGRRDMRETPTFTIDPKTAKDFDDAISFKKIPNHKHQITNEERYEIGVHIADVSHYVTEGTELDAEARKRQFSVYLVDRTIPMLPEALSNDLCSLNPDEEKLAFSAVFEMDAAGVVHKRWFGKTVIKSNKRFTYEDAYEALTSKTGVFAGELTILNEIAKKLRAKKAEEGAIEFETEEVRIELDENDRPVRIYKKARLDTHRLVEEYMLLANREVAKYCYDAFQKKNKNAPFLFRVHDEPKPERINDLAVFIRALGFELPLTEKGSVTGKDLQALLKQVEGEASEGLIKTAAVRSMSKAAYSPLNIGHFGLAFAYYTHFTSPIRRYPDLLVHRLLHKYLTGQKIGQGEFEKVQRICLDASQKEIMAAEAERDSIKYKQVEYMMARIGQVFDGVISGVTEWGMYIEEKETRAEGMVKMRDLGDDYYTLDQNNYAIVGKETKKTYSLGDTVKFTIVSADLERKTLDLKLV